MRVDTSLALPSAVGVAPLLLNAAPCVVMFSLGVCANRMGRLERFKTEPTDQAISQNGSTAHPPRPAESRCPSC
jgi:hypothetical protein